MVAGLAVLCDDALVFVIALGSRLVFAVLRRG
jgi:hypothetical protein